MKYLAVILGILLTIPSFAQKRKRNDNSEITPTYQEGVTYALPRTGIKVHVRAIQEKFTPGPYASYANQLLGIKNAKTQASTKWLLANVEMETFSEPDPQHVYKAMGDGAFLISLANNGCLAGINTARELAPINLTQSNKTYRTPEVKDEFSFDFLTDTPNYTEGDSSNNYETTRVTAYQKAAQAAKRILNCRMNQYDMAALMMDGEHPDGQAYQVSMDELKRIEKDYIQLFVGRTTYKEELYSFDFVPDEKPNSGQAVFRISDNKGIVPASDLSGKPVVIEFEQNATLAQQYTKNISSDNPSAGEKGVYYRMPGLATVKIIHEMNVVASLRTTIAQFGAVAPLPEKLLQGDYSVELHPETGAIKSITKK